MPRLEPGRLLGATPSDLTGPLPADLSLAAARRLGVVCLVWASLWGLGLVLNNLVGPLLSPGKPLDDAWPSPGNPVAAVVILVSLGLFGYTRRRSAKSKVSLDLGLWYEAALALAIGIVNQWTPNITGLSWICALVLIHPTIVPNTAGKTLAAALAAASMDPAGLLISHLRGVEMPAFSQVLWYLLPTYICAFLAVLPAHILTRMGREVREARELGSYRLGELLGRGGMGEVYAARHRMLHRPAAIKLIRPAPGVKVSDVVVERFKREAQTAANLHSPHTIALYDFGTTARGEFYYVMELLNGLDLEVLVERFGEVPPARVVHMLTQACASLSEAHALGLVHRDIKPANLLTCWLGLEADFVKVLDFGLVKRRFDEEEGSAKLTRPDNTPGTPAYVSPEMLRGDPVDGRADLYALGCVAHWLLAGRLVFVEDTPMKVLLAHASREPEPPSVHAEQAIPRALDEAVLACLAKDPARRPESATALARRLSACDAGAPWTQEDAAAWWRKHVPELVPGTLGSVGVSNAF